MKGYVLGLLAVAIGVVAGAAARADKYYKLTYGPHGDGPNIRNLWSQNSDKYQKTLSIYIARNHYHLFGYQLLFNYS